MQFSKGFLALPLKQTVKLALLPKEITNQALDEIAKECCVRIANVSDEAKKIFLTGGIIGAAYYNPLITRFFLQKMTIMISIMRKK